MVPSHRACGFAAGAALFPAYRWDLFDDHSLPRMERVDSDKVTAGETPAAHATLALMK